MMRRLGWMRLGRRCAAAPQKRKPPPEGGRLAQFTEDVARVLLVYTMCLAVTAVFGLQITMALIGVIAAAFALVLTFGPRSRGGDSSSG